MEGTERITLVVERREEKREVKEQRDEKEKREAKEKEKRGETEKQEEKEKREEKENKTNRCRLIIGRQKCVCEATVKQKNRKSLFQT